MKYKVKVTRNHIRAGTPGECCACPVALALDDAFPDFHFDVYMQTAKVYPQGEHWTHNSPTASLNLPLAVSRFIRRFDSGRPCRPFTFTVEA